MWGRFLLVLQLGPTEAWNVARFSWGPNRLALSERLSKRYFESESCIMSHGVPGEQEYCDQERWARRVVGCGSWVVNTVPISES